jgi:hypothetical protein
MSEGREIWGMVAVMNIPMLDRVKQRKGGWVTPSEDELGHPRRRTSRLYFVSHKPNYRTVPLITSYQSSNSKNKIKNMSKCQFCYL